MNKVVAGLAGVMLLAAFASAQEAEVKEETEVRAPRRKIRVLRDPYDLASFYRSSPGPASTPEYFGAYPLTDRSTFADRYPLASYYRQGGSTRGRYSRFWTSDGAGAAAWGSRRFAPVRKRRVGASELCLLAPTFLAPVAPLTDIDR